MIRIANTQLWVHDQDEALAFYTDQLGFEVQNDISMHEMGGFRWLTVSPPAQPDVSIALMAIPGEPIMDDATNAQVRDLLARGFAGTLFLTTDDVHGAYEQLRARGVEFVDEPTPQPYGIDCSFRDPSGNNFRLAQLHELPTRGQLDGAFSPGG